MEIPEPNQHAAPAPAENTNQTQADTNINSGTWLQPFIDDRESGLFIFETSIAREKDVDVLEQFGDAFLAVKEKLGDVFVDEISFGEAFTKWQTVKKNTEGTAADRQLAQSNLEWLFARCIKDIYFIGSFTFPAMHFCASAEPLEMAEERAFHGYNERTLSKEKALILASDMEASYQAVSGQESIYFMFQKPANSYVDVVHVPTLGKEATPCSLNTHSRRDVVNCFLNTTFTNKVFVPKMFIPSCGQVYNLPNISNLVVCYCIIFLLNNYLTATCCCCCSTEPLPCHIFTPPSEQPSSIPR